MNRGDRREPIFLDNLDRELFTSTLGETCRKTAWEVHAYCWMPNHFHLVIETPRGNLVAGMKWFLGTYTGRFNRRHKLFGHLFSGRYKALIVDGSGTGYLRTVCEYVHLNPVRAKLLGPEKELQVYAWSSFPAYLLPPGKRPPWLRVDRVFGEMGIRHDTKAGREHFGQQMEQRRRSEVADNYGKIRRGWCLGEEDFRKELLAGMGARMGAEHYGEERHESATQRAESVVAEELRKRRLSRAELAALPKGHRAKVEMARRIQAETTVPVGWIAEHLEMGTRSYAYRLLYLDRKKRSRRQ